MLNNFKGGVPTLKGKQRRDLNNIPDYNLVPKNYYRQHLNVNELTDSLLNLSLDNKKPVDSKPVDSKPVDTNDLTDDLTKQMANLFKKKVLQKMKLDPVKSSTRIRKQTKFFDPSYDEKVKKAKSLPNVRKAKSITQSQKLKNQNVPVSNQEKNNKLGEKLTSQSQNRPRTQHHSPQRTQSQNRPRTQHQSQPTSQTPSQQRTQSQNRPRTQHQSQPTSQTPSQQRSQPRSRSQQVRSQNKSNNKKESSREIATQLSNIFTDLSKVIYEINQKRNLPTEVEPSQNKKQRM